MASQGHNVMTPLYLRNVQLVKEYLKFLDLVGIGFVVGVFLHGYRKISNIRRTLVGNKIVDHSDVP